MRWGAVVSLLAALVLWVPGGASGSEQEAWLENSLTILLTPVWELELSHEVRARELDYDDTRLQNVAIGLTRKLPREVSVGLFYKREKEDTSTGSRIEDRYYVDLGLGGRPTRRLRIDGRLRTELRRFRRGAANDVIRFRFRLRLRTRAEVASLKLRPFVWTEVFTGHEQPLRNRFSAGAVLELHRHVGVSLGYVRQDTRGREPLNVLRSGLELAF